MANEKEKKPPKARVPVGVTENGTVIYWTDGEIATFCIGKDGLPYRIAPTDNERRGLRVYDVLGPLCPEKSPDDEVLALVGRRVELKTPLPGKATGRSGNVEKIVQKNRVLLIAVRWDAGNSELFNTVAFNLLFEVLNEQG